MQASASTIRVSRSSETSGPLGAWHNPSKEIDMETLFNFSGLLGRLWESGRAWWLARPVRVSKHAKGRRKSVNWREKRKKRRLMARASRRRNRGK